MSRRIPPLSWLVALLLGATIAPVAVPAQPTPAERASRALNEEIVRDRRRDAADDSRAADTQASTGTPLPNAAAQQLEGDRATIRPDVGRPEQAGQAAGTLRTTGEDRNVTR
jgi:hypothetical protein